MTDDTWINREKFITRLLNEEEMPDTVEAVEKEVEELIAAGVIEESESGDEVQVHLIEGFHLVAPYRAAQTFDHWSEEK